MAEALPALVGLLACGAGGALTPYVIRVLPEPEPDPVPETEEEVAALTPAQRARLDEPPKEPYAALGRLPGLPLLTGSLAAVAGASLGQAYGWDWLLVVLWPLVPVGVLLAVVDWRTKLLPSVVVLPATAAALLYGVVRWAATGDHDELVRGLVALLVVRSVFWVLWFIRQAGMGFGDVRLSALVGCVLGYAGWGEVVVGVYAAFLLFGVPGLVLALARRNLALLKRAYPFGPFLLGGAWLALLVADPLFAALYT